MEETLTDLPVFIGSAGSKAAHAQGLVTLYRLEREGRRLKLRAQPRALYKGHEHASTAYPLYAIDDTEPAARAAIPPRMTRGPWPDEVAKIHTAAATKGRMQHASA